MVCVPMYALCLYVSFMCTYKNTMHVCASVIVGLFVDVQCIDCSSVVYVCAWVFVCVGGCICVYVFVSL